jgi:hypothetical protein
MRMQDFAIQGPCDVRPCGNKPGFRAVRRTDGRPVILHYFRPKDPLEHLAPNLDDHNVEDFSRPFMTHFIGWFCTGGSGWLVESLPSCVPLEDLWMHILWEIPGNAPAVARMLAEQLQWIEKIRLEYQSETPIVLENIILGPCGAYGLLASFLPGSRKSSGLRFRTSEGISHPIQASWMTALGESLLGIERRLSRLRQRSILSADERLFLTHLFNRRNQSCPTIEPVEIEF